MRRPGKETHPPPHLLFIYFLSDSQTSVVGVAAIHFLLFAPRNPLDAVADGPAGQWFIHHDPEPTHAPPTPFAILVTPPQDTAIQLANHEQLDVARVFLVKKGDFPQFSGSKNRPPLIPFRPDA